MKSLGSFKQGCDGNFEEATDCCGENRLTWEQVRTEAGRSGRRLLQWSRQEMTVAETEVMVEPTAGGGCSGIHF